MKNILRSTLILLFLIKWLSPQIALIPIAGEIEPSIYKYLKRAIADAEAMKPDRIVFLINTFGGELNTTFQIVDLISAIDIPTTTLVEEKAISAGTLIAMASGKIYMQSNSIMGDVAPISMGAEGPQMLGEKFQSPLRAKFRALAQKNGYPVKLSEAFVSVEKEIIEVRWEDGSITVMDSVEFGDLSEKEKENMLSRRTLVAKGELLTMSDREAVDFGFSSGTVNSPEDLAKLLSEDPTEIIRLDKTESEKTFAVFLKYSWLLILLGLGGVYLEVKNPGFGFYGILAIIAFGAFFIGQYLVELADYVELILLITGLILLGVEVLVLPGFGIFGGLGILLLLGSLVMMRQNFIIPDDVFQWDLFTRNLELVLYVFLGSLVLLFLSFTLGRRVMARSPLIFNKKLFESPAGESSRNRGEGEMIGETGTTITKLVPTGRVEIAGKIYDAIIPNDFLEINTAVKVVGKDGYLLVVERENRHG